MKNMNDLNPYDRLAVLMAIEEKVFRLCEPLREMKGEPLNSKAYNAVRKAERELRKLQGDKCMDVFIGGQCEEAPHSMVDMMVEKEFGSKVMADSEGDAIFIHCNNSIKKHVLHFLREHFKDIELHSSSRKKDAPVEGLGNWDDAMKWVKKKKLEHLVVVDEAIKKRIAQRFDQLISEKKEKYEKKLAELETFKNAL